MTLPAVRPLGAFGMAAAVLAVTAGPVAAGVDTTDPSADPAGCAEITLALDTVEAFGLAFVTGDVETLEALLPQLPGTGADAAAAAPADIAETVETWVAPIPLIVAELAAIDLADRDAFAQAVAAVDTGARDTAGGEVEAWAESNCGWQSSLDVDQIEAPEPPECEELDADAAAEAAGIDVDASDLDGSADVNLPGFWTKSCSYGNGAMGLSTFGFVAIEDAQRFYADNMEAADAVVLDVDVGTLPESTLVVQTGVATGSSSSVPSSDEPAPVVRPTVQVAVFEAPTPFSVLFTGDDVDPATVVAAAEAVLAAQAAGGEPPPTDVATTA